MLTLTIPRPKPFKLSRRKEVLEVPGKGILNDGLCKKICKIEGKLQTVKDEVVTLQNQHIVEVQKEICNVVLDTHIEKIKQKYEEAQKNNTIIIPDDDNKAYECLTLKKN